jgi:hypothetical protein
LLTQPCHVPVALLPAGSPLVQNRYSSIAPWLGKELVVVDDGGNTWVGPAAFVVCLWATAKYRAVSYVLARRSMAPLAEHFFLFISKRRDRFGRWVHGDETDCSWCDSVIVGRDQL